MISNIAVNVIVDSIDERTRIESPSMIQSMDCTPEKPTRHTSDDSLQKSTINIMKENRHYSSSPVSVANIFDNGCLLNSIDPLPYSDYDSDFDNEVDEFFAFESVSKNANITQKKRVRFQVDEDGNIEEDVSLYSFPDYKLTSKLVRECWYNKEDRVQTKIEIQRRCKEHATSVSNIEKYHEAMVSAITYLVQCDDDAEDHVELKEEMVSAMAIIAQGETRGMERSLQFHMGMPRIGTKTNVHAVLRVQTLIRELDSSKYDEFEVEELIADQCIINSQYGVRWAKLIALGDAEDVRRS